MHIFRIVVILMLLSCAPVSIASFLLDAAAKGDIEKVEALIASGVNLEICDPATGQTALMKAAAGNQIEVTRLLVDAGANLEAYSKYGSTPLSYAAKSADAELIQYLLSKGAKVNGQKSDGYTPLMSAANLNSPEIVKLLLKNGADIHFKTPTRWTVMHAAAIRNQAENIEVLIEAGAKPSPRNTRGWTPLMIAAQYGNSEAAKALIAGKANPSESNGDINAIVAAARFGNYETALLLANAGADLRGTEFITAPLVYAVSNGQYDLAKRMIELGAPVPQYASGLYGAALGSHSRCVELLCEHGAVLNRTDWEKVQEVVLERSDVRSHIAIYRALQIKDATDSNREQIAQALQPAFEIMLAAHQGRADDLQPMIEPAMRDHPWSLVAAYHYAQREGRIDTIEQLQSLHDKAKRLADRKPNDLKALTKSAKANDAETMKRLLEKGADPNFGDPKEYSPMMIAIRGKQPALVKLLLEHGADPNRDPGWNSRSPLAQACYKGNPEIVKLLLDAGADPDAGGDGFTPLYFSAGKGELESIEALLEAGADINLGCPGFEKCTALIAAASKGQAEAVTLLVKEGANIEQEDEKGFTALSAATANAHTDVARQLIRLGAKPPENYDGLRPKIALLDVSNSGRLQRLLKAGADPNEKSVRLVHPDGVRYVTPLDELLSKSRVKHECVVLLLEAGADLKLTSGPLVNSHIMSEKTVDLLLKSGADVNQGDPFFMGGVRPLQLAAVYGKFELFQKLLEAGADPSLRSLESKLTLDQVIRGWPTVHPEVKEERLTKTNELIAAWRGQQGKDKPGGQDK
ncbi:MAG: ankyrin repeat domain-containing protein [Planctomycetota bacterium]